MKKLNGFTFFELLVVVGIIAVVTTLTLPLAFSQNDSSKISSLMMDISSKFFLQQQNAYAAKNNQTYGIYFSNVEPYSYSIFTGSSYATSSDIQDFPLTAEYSIDEINFLNSGNEIYFVSNSFRPSTTGTVKITVNKNISYNLEINSEGLITYYKL